MNHTDPPRPACAGLHNAPLFEATDPHSHKEARAICLNECPVLEACKALLEVELTASAGTRKAGGGPSGTWAGQLVGGPPGQPRVREHGSERGYQQHRHRKEAICAECRAAHNEHVLTTYGKAS